MKRIITVFLALLLCTAVAVPAFSEGEANITIKLSETALEIGTGNKLKLDVATESTEKIKYAWESSDKKIASVDGKGTVSGVKEGEAVITCTALLGKETIAAATCSVKVYTSVKSVKAKSPVKGNVLFINQPAQIETTVAPDNAAYPKLIWTSSDESIATVNENGVVTAHQPGKVKITCATDQPNQGKAITADIQFTVKQQVEEIRPSPTELVFWAKEIVPDAGDSAEITIEVLPESANDRKVKWEISNKNIASVNNGKIKANKAGAATITVTAADGGGTTAVCGVFVLGAYSYRFSASALEDAGIVFTEDGSQATETAGKIVRAALNRLDETENTSRAAMLAYFARKAAANGNLFLTGSLDEAAFPVTVMMSDDAGNCAMLTYDPVWNTFYFSTARQFAGNDFLQVQVDGAAFAGMTE